MKVSNPSMPTKKDHSSASDPAFIGRTFSAHRNPKTPSHERIDSGHYMVSRLSSDEESESDEEVIAMSPVRDLPKIMSATNRSSLSGPSVPLVPPAVSALLQAAQRTSSSSPSQLYALLTSTAHPSTAVSIDSGLTAPPGSVSRAYSTSPAPSASIISASALRLLPSCFNFAIAEQQPRASYKFSTPEETLTHLFQCLTLAYRYTFTCTSTVSYQCEPLLYCSLEASVKSLLLFIVTYCKLIVMRGGLRQLVRVRTNR